MGILFKVGKQLQAAVWTLTHTFNNPNPDLVGTNEQFGAAVAATNSNVIIGAPYESVNGTSSGNAYVYNILSGALVHTFSNPNVYDTSDNDNFGYSVALTDSYAIVGARGEDSAAGLATGSVYVFNVSTGALVYTLIPNILAAGDNFGCAIAADGDYCVIGAWGNTGKACVYNLVSGELLHTLASPAQAASSRFGDAVAIHGNNVVIGAYLESDVNGIQSGIAYVYNRTTGALVHTLANPNSYGISTNDNFGDAVACDNLYAYIGASGEGSSVASIGQGTVYVFDLVTGALVREIVDPNPVTVSGGDAFGGSVAVSGNYLVVGAHSEDEIGATNSGKAHIFDITTGTLLYTLDNPNAYGTAVGDRFGNPVAISGSTVIVGAFQEDDGSGSNNGKAYIFTMS